MDAPPRSHGAAPDTAPETDDQALTTETQPAVAQLTPVASEDFNVGHSTTFGLNSASSTAPLPDGLTPTNDRSADPSYGELRLVILR